MKVNELEKNLGLSRANIRFYEKEGLLQPARRENGYRDYSEEDVHRLQQIIVLRKLGLSVEEIRSLLTEDVSLEQALTENRIRLQEQLKTIRGALRLSDELLTQKTQLQTMDTERCLDRIRQEEAGGSRFFDIAADYLKMEHDLLDRMTGGGGKSMPAIAAILLICAVGRGFVNRGRGGSFAEGFFSLFLVCLAVSVLWLPVFFLRRNEAAAARYIRILTWVAGGFLLLVLALVLVLWLNSLWHFWF